MEEKRIVVTGFGPFIGHEVINASWEAVRLLPDAIQHNGSNYKIEKLLVPVQYDAVDKCVDDIWKMRPELVIHCGVNGNAKSIHLEKLAYNNKFCRPDYAGKTLKDPNVFLEATGYCCESISTELDVLAIVRKLCSEPVTETPLFVCSRDVGNYLCGYIYLKSLDRDRKRCLFIHVPRIDKIFSPDVTSNAISSVIKECLHQLQTNK